MKKFITLLFTLAFFIVLVSARRVSPADLNKPAGHAKLEKKATFNTCENASNFHGQHVGMTFIITFSPPNSQYNYFTYGGYGWTSGGHPYSGTTGQSGFQLFPWTGGTTFSMTTHCTCNIIDACQSTGVVASLP